MQPAMQMHRATPPPLPPRSTRPAPPAVPPRPPPPPIPLSTRPQLPQTPTSPLSNGSATAKNYEFLTPSQVSHFLTYGFVTLPGAFDISKAAPWLAQLWTRLGASPTDRSTWKKERTHLPSVSREHVSTFAPAAWGAICELLGGADRVDSSTAYWSDAFIVNLGVPGSEPDPQGKNEGHKVWDWHVDGDFFTHFLDSGEQALLVVPLFEDIVPGGGGTMVAPESVGIVSRYLAEHPEGVSPSFGGDRWFIEQAKQCQHFVELTGKAGDVVLLHPFMLHSATRNYLRTPRVITNPRVGMKRPFAYGRDGSELSLVEKKTLMELGVDRLEWQATGARKFITPERMMKKKKPEVPRKVSFA